MKYLENAFRFFGKYYFLAIPLFIVNAISGLLFTMLIKLDYKELYDALMESFQMGVPVDEFQMKELLMGMIPDLGMLAVLAGSIILLNIIVVPATFGMINKAYSIGEAGLIDFFPQLGKNILKYIVFLLGALLVGIVISLVMTIISFLIGLLSAVCCIFTVVLIPIGLVYILGSFCLVVGFHMWFIAMVTDNLGVFEALSKTIKIIKTSFWPIVGITALTTVGYYIIITIVSFVAFLVPLVGPIINGVITAIYIFITIVFAFEVYRDKTNAKPDDGITYIDGLPESDEYL